MPVFHLRRLAAFIVWLESQIVMNFFPNNTGLQEHWGQITGLPDNCLPQVTIFGHTNLDDI